MEKLANSGDLNAEFEKSLASANSQALKAKIFLRFEDETTYYLKTGTPRGPCDFKIPYWPAKVKQLDPFLSSENQQAVASSSSSSKIPEDHNNNNNIDEEQNQNQIEQLQQLNQQSSPQVASPKKHKRGYSVGSISNALTYTRNAIRHKSSPSSSSSFSPFQKTEDSSTSSWKRRSTFGPFRKEKPIIIESSKYFKEKEKLLSSSSHSAEPAAFKPRSFSTPSQPPLLAYQTSSQKVPKKLNMMFFWFEKNFKMFTQGPKTPLGRSHLNNMKEPGSQIDFVFTIPRTLNFDYFNINIGTRLVESVNRLRKRVIIQQLRKSMGWDSQRAAARSAQRKAERKTKRRLKREHKRRQAEALRAAQEIQRVEEERLRKRQELAREMEARAIEEEEVSRAAEEAEAARVVREAQEVAAEVEANEIMAAAEAEEAEHLNLALEQDLEEDKQEERVDEFSSTERLNEVFYDAEDDANIDSDNNSNNDDNDDDDDDDDNDDDLYLPRNPVSAQPAPSTTLVHQAPVQTAQLEQPAQLSQPSQENETSNLSPQSVEEEVADNTENLNTEEVTESPVPEEEETIAENRETSNTEEAINTTAPEEEREEERQESDSAELAEERRRKKGKTKPVRKASNGGSSTSDESYVPKKYVPPQHLSVSVQASLAQAISRLNINEPNIQGGPSSSSSQPQTATAAVLEESYNSNSNSFEQSIPTTDPQSSTSQPPPQTTTNATQDSLSTSNSNKLTLGPTSTYQNRRQPTAESSSSRSVIFKESSPFLLKKKSSKDSSKPKNIFPFPSLSSSSSAAVAGPSSSSASSSARRQYPKKPSSKKIFFTNYEPTHDDFAYYNNLFNNEEEDPHEKLLPLAFQYIDQQEQDKLIYQDKKDCRLSEYGGDSIPESVKQERQEWLTSFFARLLGYKIGFEDTHCMYQDSFYDDDSDYEEYEEDLNRFSYNINNSNNNNNNGNNNNNDELIDEQHPLFFEKFIKKSKTFTEEDLDSSSEDERSLSSLSSSSSSSSSSSLSNKNFPHFDRSLPKKKRLHYPVSKPLPSSSSDVFLLGRAAVRFPEDDDKNKNKNDKSNKDDGDDDEDKSFTSVKQIVTTMYRLLPFGCWSVRVLFDFQGFRGHSPKSLVRLKKIYTGLMEFMGRMKERELDAIRRSFEQSARRYKRNNVVWQEPEKKGNKNDKGKNKKNQQQQQQLRRNVDSVGSGSVASSSEPTSSSQYHYYSDSQTGTQANRRRRRVRRRGRRVCFDHVLNAPGIDLAAIYGDGTITSQQEREENKMKQRRQGMLENGYTQTFLSYYHSKNL